MSGVLLKSMPSETPIPSYSNIYVYLANLTKVMGILITISEDRSNNF